ncbi:redoxin domain-containing protein [Mangrovihabitans endophyticus]|uniref:Thiol:disulfide interchange protein n=1 Tax=Mangrovihabitans endophyticus TaxID=1751298 RepID=A0A8J3C2D9_9ACTN|nr:redoxin domain-containing protein [Mangrovihabitans endophyticus]GGK99762.1 thiol:disulfide interchange protein [Mangrovihabitans endophyticus]
MRVPSVLRVRAAAPALVLLFLAAACANGGAVEPGAAPASDTAPPGPSTVATATDSSAAPARSGDAAVPPLLRFTAQTVDGAAFNAAALAGRPVVFWFWAPWCPTCAGQARDVAAVARDTAGRISVVGVGGLDGEANMRTFVHQFHVDGLPHLSDEAGAVWRRFGVTQQSTFVMLDGSGRTVFSGYLPGDQLAGRVGKLT